MFYSELKCRFLTATTTTTTRFIDNSVKGKSLVTQCHLLGWKYSCEFIFLDYSVWHMCLLTNFQRTKLYCIQNLSLGFILEIVLKFPKLQPLIKYILVKKSVIHFFISLFRTPWIMSQFRGDDRYYHLISNKREWSNCFIKSATKP